MAKQLDNEKVKMGNLIKVENLDRKHNRETYTHYAMKVEDENGDNERWLLFTEKQVMGVSKMLSRVSSFLKAGRLYPSVRNGKTSYYVKVANRNNEVWTVTERLLKTAEDRALRHSEDIPKQSRLADLMD